MPIPFNVRKANCVGSAMTSESLAEEIPCMSVASGLLLELLRGGEMVLWADTGESFQGAATAHGQ